MSRTWKGRLGRRVLSLGAAAGVLVAGGLVAVNAQAAAAGCRVTYTVSTQWSVGFTANVAVTNLGDAVRGWQLTWTFAPGQQVTQAWNAVVTQSGSQVTAVNAGYNPEIGANQTASFGFNGSWSGSNPVPTAFALNGVACTGTPVTTSPTVTPTGSPAPSATPTSRPPTTSPATVPPSTTPPRTTPPTPVPSVSTPTTPPAAYPNPGAVSGNTGVHDPTIVKTPAGGYILVHTGNNVSIKTSTDRTTFRNAGSVFPNGAPWTTTYTAGSQNLWAPDISYHNGRYYLYYSASTFGSNRSAIFLATSTTGASGSWTNQGLVIESSSSNNYNAIDPNLLVDSQGQWWLTFGSFWSGIKMIALDPATGKRSDTVVRNAAGRNGGAIEAPTLVKHGSYYYLWVSFDLCCRGASSTYRILVGRSTSPTGPFVDRNGTAMTNGGGTQVLAGHGNIHGPGHQAVLTDTDGDVLVYHYYTNSGSSQLGINRIGYDAAGWPFVY